MVFDNETPCGDKMKGVGGGDWSAIRYSGIDDEFIMYCCDNLGDCGFSKLSINANSATIGAFDKPIKVSGVGIDDGGVLLDFIPSIVGSDGFCGIPNECGIFGLGGERSRATVAKERRMQAVPDSLTFLTGPVLPSGELSSFEGPEISSTEETAEAGETAEEETTTEEPTTTAEVEVAEEEEGEGDDDDDSDDSDDNARMIFEENDDNQLDINNDGLIDNDDNDEEDEYSININFSAVTLMHLWGMIAILLICNLLLFIYWKRCNKGKNNFNDSSSINDI